MWGAFVLGLGAGIAATPHCLGMCGGFPLHLAKSSRRGAALPRQVLFVAGKSLTYVFLGALAGALGVVLFKDTSLARLAPALRLAAGLAIVLFGVLMLGFRLPPIRALQGLAESPIIRGLFGALLVSPGPAAAFVLGLCVGFLPCPLPVGMLAVAAASHDVSRGMVLMAGVGLGTAPGLLAAGLFGVGLDRKLARAGMRAAGVIVLTLGLLTIGRATAGIIHSKAGAAHDVPPCCAGHAASER